ncbi:hypothetical protein OK074_8032 [Actinobacteria bacterium OK074]|nr:hypothetical protein OK074_8032 [Actinobacteria bacterium OK074]
MGRLRSGGPIALLLAAVLSSVSGCSALGVGGSAPLGDASGDEIGSAQVCMPGKTGTTVTFGGEVLHNSGTGNVVIDKVSLLKPEGLRFVAAVMLHVHESLLGYDNQYPPTKFFLASVGPAWDRRQPAVGATLAPQGPDDVSDDDATQSAESPADAAPATTRSTSTATVNNLVIAVKVTGHSPEARMTGVTVDYHVGRTKYRWHNITSLVVQTEKPKCS